MKKSCELVSLRGYTGHYVAGVYNRETNSFKEIQFLFYKKHEVFNALRNQLDCVVGERFRSPNKR